jgi:hypothetical protein
VEMSDGQDGHALRCHFLHLADEGALAPSFIGHTPAAPFPVAPQAGLRGDGFDEEDLEAEEDDEDEQGPFLFPSHTSLTYEQPNDAERSVSAGGRKAIFTSIALQTVSTWCARFLSCATSAVNASRWLAGRGSST